MFNSESMSYRTLHKLAIVLVKLELNFHITYYGEVNDYLKKFTKYTLK